MNKYDTALQKREANIKEISERKETSIEVMSARKDAIPIAIFLAEHPEINPNTFMEGLMRTADALLYYGTETKKEVGMTIDEAVREAEKVFPPEEQTKPESPVDSYFEPWTPPQRGKLFATMRRAGLDTKPKQLAFVEMVLGLPTLNDLEQMNGGRGPSKEQASTLIEAAMKRAK